MNKQAPAVDAATGRAATLRKDDCILIRSQIYDCATAATAVAAVDKSPG